MPDQHRRHIPEWLPLLAAIWGLGAVLDLLWLTIDRAIPSWDPADHLIGSLNYWWTLQNVQWSSDAWWQGLWTLSSKYPPLLYIATAPFISLFGRGVDQAIAVNLLFSAILLGAVFGMGKALFNARVGLWASGLCLLFPRFYTVRTEYFMDYPLTALVAVSFLCLTLWRGTSKRWQQWGWAIAFGISFGLSLLMKQSALFFVVVPLLCVSGIALGKRQWQRLAQLSVAGIMAIAFILPWLSTNWLFQISAGFNSNVKSAIEEGDPALNTLGAWTFYLNDLGRAISLPLLIVPLLGLVLYWTKLLPPKRDRSADPQAEQSIQPVRSQEKASLIWLLLFCGGAYLLWSAILNKDYRYIMPYLSGVAVILGYGMSCWRYRWRSIPWATVGLAIVLMLVNVFPIGNLSQTTLLTFLSPQAQHQPYLGAEYPHQAVVDEIIKAQPYQVVNLGLLHSTALINQHNFTYYGNRRNFRVYARRMGNVDRFLEQDVRSMSWFLSKTKERPDSAKERRRQAKLLDRLRNKTEFKRQSSWDLPDGSRLNLYRRRAMPIEVQPLTDINSVDPSGAVQLRRIIMPSQALPGTAVPVTYEWTGSWEQLHSGLVLLRWRRQDTPFTTDQRQNYWLHDHGIGLGTLHPQSIQANQPIAAKSTIPPDRPFQVIEQTAMLPPASTVAGTYTLEATYLNATTGETYPITVPLTATLTIDPTATPVPAPELDWITQLRSLATNLPEGIPALEPVFDQLSRFNLYDPVQSYTQQAEQLLAYRLQQEPQNAEYAYGLALSRVLQRQVEPAIAALEQVIRLDRDNPNAYAYLAFVNLYALRPKAAERAIEPALALKSDSAEIQALGSLAALMQGNLWQAWQRGQSALHLSSG